MSSWRRLHAFERIMWTDVNLSPKAGANAHAQCCRFGCVANAYWARRGTKDFICCSLVRQLTTTRDYLIWITNAWITS